MKELTIAKKTELHPGQMKEIAIDDDGNSLLLSNIDGEFYATGCCCTHYGAPLTDGTLHGDEVICPWHSAVFNLKTGDLSEPPALDALARYATRIDGDDVVVTLPEKFASKRTPAMATHDPEKDHRTFVILGAGAAGNAAAQTLREDGFQGRVVMITHEKHLPYDRPNLSKSYLQGEAKPAWMPLRSEKFYETYGIEVLRLQRVINVDVGTKLITFEDGGQLRYDQLLLATGSTPRTLTIPGSDLSNVFTLRYFDDADAILAAGQQASRVAVIGASFIGIEAAFSLSRRDLSVTVIAPESVPFERTLGKGLGMLVQQTHEKNGITFKLGHTPEKFEGTGAVETVVLDNSERIDADIVIMGIGVAPAVPPLQGLTLQPDGSVKVDSSFRATETVYAAGDIATFPDVRTGEQIRIEHWRTAEQQGVVAAHNMMGKKLVYESVPFFWTKQGDLNIKYAGYAREWDEVIIQGDIAAQNCLVFYVKQNQVLAVAGIKRGQQLGAIQALMRQNKMPNAEEIRRGERDWQALLTA